MAGLTLDHHRRSLPLAMPFRIAGHVFTTADALVVTLSDGDHVGQGEAQGVYYLGDDVAAMVAAVETARHQLEAGIDHDELRAVMPAGGARNAVDAALWELDARRTGRPVWQLAGLDRPPQPVATCFTVGAASPAEMADRSQRPPYRDARQLKLKLTGDVDLDTARVAAVRTARPDCWIGVDANQGFCARDLPALIARLDGLDVRLIEQPLARDRDADLAGLRSPLPLAADESLLTLADVDRLAGLFDIVNIKLDKCGGLTEGLLIAARARALGMGVMVGNMVGSSVAMAPAFLLAQQCDLVDLDGPIFLACEDGPTIVYRDGTAWCPETLWGRRSTDEDI